MSKKEEYIKKAKAKLDEQMAKLDQLKTKAQGEIAEQKLKSQGRIHEIETKITTAKAHLAEITDAAGDTWENVKGRFEDLADDIGNSFRKFFGHKDEQQGQVKPSGKEDQPKK